ncbi:hypothetical protein ABZV25_11200 [Micrococcus luteus]
MSTPRAATSPATTTSAPSTRAIPDPEAAGGLLALAEFVTRRSN